MGDAARRHVRLSQGERLDLGLELSQQLIDAVLRRVAVPPDATPEERTRLQFRTLREASRR